jgi:hypothetical protein
MDKTSPKIGDVLSVKKKKKNRGWIVHPKEDASSWRRFSMGKLCPGNVSSGDASFGDVQYGQGTVSVVTNLHKSQRSADMLVPISVGSLHLKQVYNYFFIQVTDHKIYHF